jgi:hypothetical protein
MMTGRLLLLCVFIFAVATSGQAEDGAPVAAATVDGDRIVKYGTAELLWQQNTADTNSDAVITAASYPKGDKMTWQDGMNYCQSLSFAGATDWRLPKITELKGLVEISHSYPSVNPAFQCESDSYWSATTSADKTRKAQYVHFNFGTESSRDKTKSAYVRCVSTGK